MLAMVGWSATAHAQTWTGSRSTPTLNEIVAIDATGESPWPYGSEDVAGDGATFMQQEQSIDIRTAYATADNALFWSRVYVSDENAAGGNVTVFVFIDNDRNNSTGGGADATEVNSLFTTDPTNGGFEYVIEVGGNAMLQNIWEWTENMSEFQPINLMPMDGTAEADRDRDPIDIGLSSHGYIQASVDLDVLGLTSACNADLFFRSVIDAGQGEGDLDIGLLAPCVPTDADNDDVPDILDPPGGCTTDDECPGGGVCVDGDCYIPGQCFDDTDCDSDETCNADGICVPVGGGMCSDDPDCDDLICDNGTCGPCSGDECGPGRICAPDGRCIDGTAGGGGAGGGGLDLQPGDNVQGGAFTCAVGGGDDRMVLLALLASLALLGCRRRRHRDAS